MPWNEDGTRKGSAFYLKSGNTTPFKQMGSSPVKQKGNPYKGWHPQDIKVDKLATKNLSKVDFEKKLAKITKTVDPHQQTFTKTAKVKKYGTDAINKEITRVAKGGKVKADLIKEAAKKTTKKAVKKTLTKTILKGAGKIASKFFGPIGTVLTAIEIGKTAKEAIPSLKERAKSGNVNIGRKL